ncbi:MAG: YkgJ family cysteine cluster protein [Myxococcales bacterium]|nr:YkgJ family cysteine cluster protein [Myxococcales bacterium]
MDPTPDCATCGACCREAFDSVPVVDTDERTLARQRDLVVHHDDGWRDLQRTAAPSGCGSRCAALIGDGELAPYRCTIYDDRPAACSELEVGSENCHLARRRVGLST